MEQELQELIAQIDGYIAESQDPNFDRYLEEMKQVLQAEPERHKEIQLAVARNMERYRENIRKQQKTSMEFKIGAGVLSGIGVLFVLVALVLLVKNFVPEFMQGMLLFVFFGVLWLVSQLGISRIFYKLSTGISTACIVGLYWSVLANYNTYKTLPLYWAIGILTLIAVISWAVGFCVKSTVLACTSFCGYLLFALFLPWGPTLPEFMTSLLVIVGLNLMWHLGAAGKQREAVQLAHNICLTGFSLIYGIILLVKQPQGGLVMVLLYGIVMTTLLNFIYLRKEQVGFLLCWLISTVFQTSYLIGIAITLYWRGQEIEPLLLLVVATINLLLLALRRFKSRWQGLYYQSAVLILFLTAGGLVWPELCASLVLFGVGLLLIRERVLEHELVTSLYFFLLIWILVPKAAVAPAQLAFLLGFTLLCLYMPWLRSPRESALVYTNISLMGVSLLFARARHLPPEQHYIADTFVLVLTVAAVVLLWRERCHLPKRFQGLVLSLVLTYMIVVYQIRLPVVVSILLMIVAIGAIIGGFIRKEMAMRIYGLSLSLFVCAKVVVYDYWDLELLPKSILLLVVGLIAIAIAVIYAVLEMKQKKRYMPDIMTPVEDIPVKSEGGAQESGTAGTGMAQEAYILPAGNEAAAENEPDLAMKVEDIPLQKKSEMP